MEVIWWIIWLCICALLIAPLARRFGWFIGNMFLKFDSWLFGMEPYEYREYEEKEG